jgi:hypothetical protein
MFYIELSALSRYAKDSVPEFLQNKQGCCTVIKKGEALHVKPHLSCTLLLVFTSETVAECVSLQPAHLS